jgi:DNA-binding CsgD family transcriptional regulator
MRESSIAGEVAELGCEAMSQLAFRREALGLIGRHVGFEGALFTSLDTSLPIEEEVFSGLERGQIERARDDWTSCYAAELAPLWKVAASAGGIVIDSQVFGQRQRARMRYFNEVIGPAGPRHMMWMDLRRRGRLCAMLAFTRTGAVFHEREVDLLRSLRAVLALGDGWPAMPRRDVAAEPPIPRLTPREGEIVDLVVLGYTNGEIALALGSSANTVRNQLHGIFKKVGATTRAELAGLVARARQAPALARP